ncbi:MAG TPA: ATP-binding protein [Rhodanobacteraceae bacterium]|nr:ATP-binding protein [Rhodanobacteraceae bacterium]
MKPRAYGSVLLRPVTTAAAVLLLLLVGTVAMVYQFQTGGKERLRQITAQANTLAASVTAAVAFDDRAAAREYVHALMLDPRLDAVAVYDESGHLMAGDQRSGSPAIVPSFGRAERGSSLLVMVPARQGSTVVGSVWVRATTTPWTMQLARVSGLALLTIMAAVMLSLLGLAQRMLARANADAHRRAEELTEANLRLIAEMEHRSRAEEALRQSQKMEAVGQLSGGIAHDFNNVLMIVKSALVLLEKRLTQSLSAVEQLAETARNRLATDAQQDDAGSRQVLEKGLALVAEGNVRRQQIGRYLETANDGIDKAADLTRRLLAFARRQPLSARSVRLDDLIRDIQPLLEHSVGPNVQIQYQLASHWHVLCDVNQMENAILNLIINARDAMPEGGQITVSTADVHVDAVASPDQKVVDQVRLRVADTGVGMTEEVRSRAMDPFFTTKPVGKGTGLGLSTILGYVLQSNGRLSIDSEVGVGTSVDIVLPREFSTVSTEVA